MGILQARIPEWVAMPSSRGSSQPRDGTQFSHIASVLMKQKKITLIGWLLNVGSHGKESACNVGDLCSIPGLGRFPGEGKGYPLQNSGLENSMDHVVHGVTKSQTGLSNFHFTKLAVRTYMSNVILLRRVIELPGKEWENFIKAMHVLTNFRLNC